LHNPDCCYHPNLTPTQKQQLATELVSSVMVELGYTQAVDVTLVADSQDVSSLVSISPFKPL
jgi:hypothetical protein